MTPLDRSHNVFRCANGHRVLRSRLWTPGQRAANREDSKRWKRKESDARRIIVREAKVVPCIDCGGEWPYFVMELHHTDPSEKVATISDMTLLVSKYTRQQLETEIQKCVPLCSNCHRMRTHG